ncbi:MAG: RluA family pseudouridine synthase [Planctomycetaceae bacterium]|nr:RluA family pseudouridine synthase [Planctomycetaceae bacterium]MCB9951092.1 RluA family pseudouridine synthase [Planctomycetaceae bacterium]
MYPPKLSLTVDALSHGKRIDTFLERQLRNYTSWRLQRIIRSGAATIDHMLASQTDRVFRGQTVGIELLEPPDKLLLPEHIPLPVIYSDHWMAVVDKPAGLVAHPTGTMQHGTVVNAVQHWIDQRTPFPGLIRPGIVHRLDRQTSGLMAIALTHVSHVNLSLSFESSQVAKTYVAIVEGNVKQDSGVIKAAIGRAPTARHVLMSCRADAKAKKPAQTNYRVLQRFSGYTLVSCRPLTGRNHQIRVHMAHLGHPLVGDEFYLTRGEFKPFYPTEDDEDSAREVETGLPIRRHALHAEQLEVAHPVSGLWMTFRSELPSDFAATISALSSGHVPAVR